ncbi:acyltransferase [Psychrobacter sp.]|uniref:acyltransferase n=1 Tax=Psychrobacter sp. TaxID=56811 RepID=UPI003F959E4A
MKINANLYKSFNDVNINQYCSFFNSDLNSLTEVVDKSFLPSEFREKIKIYAKNPKKLPKIVVTALSHRFESAVIIIGQGHSERLKIRINGRKHFVYLSDNAKWWSVKGEFVLNDDANLFVGKGVSSANLHANISGEGCIIGDDVMFAQHVFIRTHTGHGFVDVQGNDFETVSSRLIIESHVWVGEHVKVFNVKNIGSCSILAYGSTVVNDVPRMHTAKGYPARSTPNTKVWVRSHKDRDIKTALYYYQKFINYKN